MVILITGVSRGIGLETAKFLVKKNHWVLGVSRSSVSFSHPNFVFIQGDIQERSIIEKCQAYLDVHYQQLDVLINNAGLLVHKKFEDISFEELHDVYAVNVFSPFRWIQAFLPYLKKSERAHIVNISSMGGMTGTQKFAGLSAYSSSKGALSILTECLAEELKEYAIGCNALALGAVQTEMLSTAFPGFKAPLNADEMAEFVGWFAVHGQKFFNGKILPVAISTP